MLICHCDSDIFNLEKLEWWMPSPDRFHTSRLLWKRGSGNLVRFLPLQSVFVPTGPPSVSSGITRPSSTSTLPNSFHSDQCDNCTDRQIVLHLHGPSSDRFDSLKTVQEEDLNLPYFHGALMNIDADQLLVNDGDFLITMRMQADINKLQFFLAVRLRRGIRRFEIKRTLTSAKLNNRSSANIGKLVESLKSDPIEIKGEKIVLKRAITKGKFQLMHKDVIFKKKIGAGAYGTVYRGRLVKTNEVIAVKKLDPEGTDEDGLAEMMKEARVMQLYDHPNIVKFHGFILDDLPYLLVLEFCNGGAVEDRLRERAYKLTVNTRVSYTFMASCGMDYLHKKNCIHRDIAARNCLIHRGVVKMADFGMCRAQSVYKMDLSKPCNVRWLAPEVWDNGETRFNTDVYAFGIMIWEFFETPYKTPYAEMRAAQVKRRTRQGYRLPSPSTMPSAVSEVMRECCHADPEKRPTAEQLKEKLEVIVKVNESSASTGVTTRTTTESKTVETKN